MLFLSLSLLIYIERLEDPVQSERGAFPPCLPYLGIHARAIPLTRMRADIFLNTWLLVAVGIALARVVLERVLLDLRFVDVLE